jgi:hypothetical protein
MNHLIPFCGRILAALLVPATLLVPAAGNGPGAENSSRFQEVFHRVSPQGDLTSLLRWIDADPEPGDPPLLVQARERFGAGACPRPEPTGIALLDDLRAAYWSYWREALRGEVRAGSERERIERAVGAVLDSHGIAVGEEESPLDRARAALEAEGLHALGGMTLPHFDLLVWRGHVPETYTVDLGDTTVAVRIVFMSDFLSYGWSHFATFGRSFPGGWATSEALFCMAESYDRISESFRISYLKHEARHFADYIRFPGLGQIDLEYRAKLTELAFADSSLYEILESFEAAADPNPRSPHALAALAVVEDMRGRLGMAAGRPAWGGASRKAIHEAAVEVLARHSRALVATGADTVSGLIEARYTEGR